MEPINFSLIVSYAVQMLIVFMVGLVLYTVSVLRTKEDMAMWYQANAMRVLLSIGLFGLIGAGLVIVPNFASILGSLGFNADQSAAGIALVVVGMLIKTKTEVRNAAADEKA